MERPLLLHSFQRNILPGWKLLLASALFLLPPSLAAQQPYDLVLKGGHVIDPASETDRVADIAVKGGQIARVAPEIPADQAQKAVDVSGLYVTPGLIDLHAHVYTTIFPDDTALLTGTTTAVDCGSSGWRTFDDFKSRIIDRAKTRVLAFINILGHGMAGDEDDVSDMDPQATAAKIKEHAGLIVGIKTAHFGRPGWDAIKRAVEAGRLSDTPIIVDDRIFTNMGRTTREKLLDVLRPGDIHTHTYNDRQLELVDRFTGKVQPYMGEARRRGVLFDLGHGGGSFLWPVATKAMAQGFPPDTISTDLHRSSIMVGEPDMPNCITKLMNLGMELPDAIRRSTVNPAKAIKKFPELGTLGEGRVADIAVLKLESGVFALKDAWGKKLMGTKRVRAVMTVRDGEVVFDEGGLAYPEWQEAGDYQRIP